MLRRRIADAINYAIRGQLHAAVTSLNAWLAPHQVEATETIQTPSIDMKTGSICLLLQDPDDPRVVHDATNPPDARSLIAQAIAAADLCGVCFELIIGIELVEGFSNLIRFHIPVADNYGLAAYGLYLFLATIWWSLHWGERRESEYKSH